MDHSYSLHSFSMGDNYGNRPVRTFSDFRNVSENLNVKWIPPLSLTNLRIFSKLKLVSFLMGLTLMFIVMASYILTWHKKGLLYTPPPDQFRPVVLLTSTAAAAAAAAAADVSSENLIDIKQLVKIIGSKLEYTPRKVPAEKEIIETDPRVSLTCFFLLYFSRPKVTEMCWQIDLV